MQSPALRRRADVSVWVPATQQPIHTLLILLHGVYGSHWVWSQKAGAHRTAQRMQSAGDIKPMVVAMPSDGLSRDGSAYLPHPHAEDAERWIVDEVPVIARLAAPNLSVGAKIAIAGLSTGATARSVSAQSSPGASPRSPPTRPSPTSRTCSASPMSRSPTISRVPHAKS